MCVLSPRRAAKSALPPSPLSPSQARFREAWLRPSGPDFALDLLEELVLLCHKLALWQQGHRGSRRAILRANLMRMLVMDDLTWRSARIGGSAGSKTVG